MKHLAAFGLVREFALVSLVLSGAGCGEVEQDATPPFCAPPEPEPGSLHVVTSRTGAFAWRTGGGVVGWGAWEVLTDPAEALALMPQSGVVEVEVESENGLVVRESRRLSLAQRRCRTLMGIGRIRCLDTETSV